MTRYAAIYGRTGLTGPGGEETLARQVRFCTEFAARNDMVVLKTYLDCTHEQLSLRPLFDRMLRDAATGIFQCVLVRSADRLGRSRDLLLDGMCRLTHADLRLVIVTHPEISPDDIRLATAQAATNRHDTHNAHKPLQSA